MLVLLGRCKGPCACRAASTLALTGRCSFALLLLSLLLLLLLPEVLVCHTLRRQRMQLTQQLLVGTAAWQLVCRRRLVLPAQAKLCCCCFRWRGRWPWQRTQAAHQV